MFDNHFHRSIIFFLLLSGGSCVPGLSFVKAEAEFEPENCWACHLLSQILHLEGKSFACGRSLCQRAIQRYDKFINLV